ncbi:hypothetical protein ACIFOC_00460 [Leucobacter aridicollis]
MVWAVDVRESSGAMEILKVFRIIDRVSAAIDAAEHSTGSDLSVFRAEVPQWVQTAVALPVHWVDVCDPEDAVPMALLKDLNHLALYLDGKVLVLDSTRRASLGDLLTEIEEALNAGGISAELKLYASRLVAEIRASISDANAGLGFDLSEALRRLWICLGAAQNEAPEKSKGVFKALREKVVPSVVSSVGSAGLIAGGTAALGLLP